MADKKWKVAERKIATALQKAAGKVRDKVLRQLVTSTGRVGHICELGFDILVGNPEDGTALVGEVKRRSLPKWLVDALVQVAGLGEEYGRNPILVFEFADDVEVKFIEVKGAKKRLNRDWAVVPFPYFEELLAFRREHARLTRYLEGDSVVATCYADWCAEQDEEEKDAEKPVRKRPARV